MRPTAATPVKRPNLWLQDDAFVDPEASPAPGRAGCEPLLQGEGSGPRPEPNPCL